MTAGIDRHPVKIAMAEERNYFLTAWGGFYLFFIFFNPHTKTTML